MTKLKLFRSRPAPTEPPDPRVRRLPGTLADLLAAGPLPLPDALRYAIDIAEALRETHKRGRIHRYLHPARVALIEGRLRLVAGGPASVSPYCSPELAAGSELDARTDIYSLGAVLHEMLSGSAPLQAPSRTALRMEIAMREPSPLVGVPGRVALLVRRCLEKKPERRLQHIDVLLAELKLESMRAGGRGMPAGREQPPEPASAWTGRVCPVCGSHDVHQSPPAGRLEMAGSRLGFRVGRCYGCYHRFIGLWRFAIETPAARARPGRV